ncbi:MAG: FIG004853: possible toxin to DivIC, partial [uncultured Frankineae bacterium]
DGPRPAGRRRGGAAARPYPSGDDRSRPPLPVLAAGRRRDPAPARRRHPVPDAVLPHLPAAGLLDRHPGVRGVDEGADRAAGRRPGPAGAVRGRRPRLRRPPRPDRGPAGGARPGRHARPGEVPARARRAQPRGRARGQPVRGRGARAAAGVVAPRALRRPGRRRARRRGAVV